MSDSFCVVSFKSIHHVIKGEHILKTAGIWTDMIPNPREITSDCGMSLKVRGDDLEAVRKALQAGHEPDFTIYRKTGSHYTGSEEERDGSSHAID